MSEHILQQHSSLSDSTISTNTGTNTDTITTLLHKNLTLSYLYIIHQPYLYIIYPVSVVYGSLRLALYAHKILAAFEFFDVKHFYVYIIIIFYLVQVALAALTAEKEALKAKLAFIDQQLESDNKKKATKNKK